MEERDEFLAISYCPYHSTVTPHTTKGGTAHHGLLTEEGSDYK